MIYPSIQKHKQTELDCIIPTVSRRQIVRRILIPLYTNGIVLYWKFTCTTMSSLSSSLWIPLWTGLCYFLQQTKDPSILFQSAKIIHENIHVALAVPTSMSTDNDDNHTEPTVETSSSSSTSEKYSVHETLYQIVTTTLSSTKGNTNLDLVPTMIALGYMLEQQQYRQRKDTKSDPNGARIVDTERSEQQLLMTKRWMQVLIEYTTTHFPDATELTVLHGTNGLLSSVFSLEGWESSMQLLPTLLLKLKSHPDRMLPTLYGYFQAVPISNHFHHHLPIISEEFMTVLVKQLTHVERSTNRHYAHQILYIWAMNDTTIPDSNAETTGSSGNDIPSSASSLTLICQHLTNGMKPIPTVSVARVAIYQYLEQLAIGSQTAVSSVIRNHSFHRWTTIELVNDVLLFIYNMTQKEIKSDARVIGFQAMTEWIILYKTMERNIYHGSGDDGSSSSRRVTGAMVRDHVTGDEFPMYAKKVVLAGGPFTDQLRAMESSSADGATTTAIPPAVRGAAGTHIVLRGGILPANPANRTTDNTHTNMGLLDFNTSDGRFLFVLPWLGHTLVGTTDDASSPTASTRHDPPEREIEWLLRECQTYLDVTSGGTREGQARQPLQRSDVLSAWRGWRPLAADPHAPAGAPVSRDHVISENPETGVVFVAGGKWTTWREMAEEVVDRIVVSGTGGDHTPHHHNAQPCSTLEIKLHGGDGYSDDLADQLVETHSLDRDIADHLVSTYGGRVWEVVDLLLHDHNNSNSKNGASGGSSNRTRQQRLLEGFPYIEAEVAYACREYACTVEDILSRRTRLAYLDKDAAVSAIPRVAQLMAETLGWSDAVQTQQIEAAAHYMASYGGRVPVVAFDDEDSTARAMNPAKTTTAAVEPAFEDRGAAEASQ